MSISVSILEDGNGASVDTRLEGDDLAAWRLLAEFEGLPLQALLEREMVAMTEDRLEWLATRAFCDTPEQAAIKLKAKELWR